MARVRGGVQQKTRQVNLKAVFVNCENHSLHLVCVHESGVHFVVLTFFLTSGETVSFFFFIYLSLGGVKIIYRPDSKKTMSNKMESDMMLWK